MFELHVTISRMILLLVLLVAFWAIVIALRGKSLSPTFWTVFVVAEAVLGAQAVVGVALLLIGLQPRDWLHVVYGLIAAATLPLANSYAARHHQREAFIIGLAALFTFGLSTRALFTG